MTSQKNRKFIKNLFYAVSCGVLAVVMAVGSCGCGMEVTANAADLMEGITAASVEGLPVDRRFQKAESELIAKFFGSVTENSRGQNVMVSPLSIQLALAMTANGAAGKTLSEMEALLGGGIPMAELNKYLKDYVGSLTSGENFKLEIADSIWFRDDADRLTVKKEFLQTNADYYGAAAYKEPFDDATLGKINKWVSDHTDGMIERILDVISDDAIMYLINAIVFDAEWASKYTSNDTYEQTFTAYSGEKKKAKFMHSTEGKYIETEDATGFIKPYAGGKYSFAALLPNEGIDVYDYVKKLGESGVIAPVLAAVDEAVSVSLPKFSFDFSVEMKDVLSQLGMPTAFDPSTADFSEMGTSGRGDIYISRVLHKSFISVDEEGTKAAAVTMAEASDSAMMMTKFVTLDRPFVFMIYDNDTSLPIFIGVLADAAR